MRLRIDAYAAFILSEAAPVNRDGIQEVLIAIDRGVQRGVSGRFVTHEQMCDGCSRNVRRCPYRVIHDLVRRYGYV